MLLDPLWVGGEPGFLVLRTGSADLGFREPMRRLRLAFSSFSFNKCALTRGKRCQS